MKIASVKIDTGCATKELYSKVHNLLKENHEEGWQFPIDVLLIPNPSISDVCNILNMLPYDWAWAEDGIYLFTRYEKGEWKNSGDIGYDISKVHTII